MGGKRGQSETLGYALILGFTLISVGAIAVFGGASLQATQQHIGAQNAENAISQFDSRASMVALGASDNQQVNLGAGQQGTYTVDGEAGWIRVVHRNVTDNTTTVIENKSLGVVTYEGDTTEIAYQGGGVWRQDASSVMLSPPEFRYRGSTLILPVIRMKGDQRVTGNPRLRIQDAGPGERAFPNASASEPATNPLESGIVTVTVKSDYYDAWGRFFETRSDGNVSVDDSNQTASLELVAPSVDGDFDMPLDGNSMTLQGIQAHQIDQFELTLIDDQGDQANFDNLDWSICAESGGQEFEIQISKGNGTDDGDTAEAIIYYSADGTNYQTWQTDAYQFEEEVENVTEDWNDDGDYDDKRLVINLTSTESATYQEESVTSFSNCDFSAKSFESTASFEGHNVAGEPTDFTEPDQTEIDFVVNHYLALMGPTVDLEVADSNQNTVSEEISTGFIDYNASDSYFLTYMHISENPVNVTIE